MKHFLSKLVLRLRARFRPCLSRRAAARQRRILVEPLEDRSLLAQLVNVGTAADVVYNLPATANGVYLEDDGTTGNGKLQLRSSNSTFDTTTFTAPTGSLTINRGNSADIITVNSLPDFSAALGIGSSTSTFATVSFVGAIALSPGRNLSVYAAKTIGLSNASSQVATSGTGRIDFVSGGEANIFAGAQLLTTDGDISIQANTQAPFRVGTLSGIFVAGSIVTVGKGKIVLNGRGENDAQSSGHNGIYILEGKIRSLSTLADAGGITLTGQGGLGTSANDGIELSGSEATIESVNGTVDLTGYGGVGSTTLNRGIIIRDGAQIKSTGTGPTAARLLMAGFGGSGTDFNIGLVIGTDSQVSTIDGLIKATGGNLGQPTGQANYGLEITDGAVRSAATEQNLGSITLAGVGGGGTSFSDGVVIHNASIVESVNGSIYIDGQGGNGTTTSNRGVTIFSGSKIKSTGFGQTAGGIYISGVGGTGTDSAYGVLIGKDSLATAVDGDIKLVGRGGTSATGSFNYGVIISGGGHVDSTGIGASAGTISITGTGGGTGAVGSDQNQGVRLDGVGSQVGSIDGDVTITGTAGPATLTTNTFSGVRLVNSASIPLTGTGSLSLSGTSAASGGRVGFALRLAGTISVAGPMATFTGDTMLLEPGNLSINAANSTVVLRTSTSGRPIKIGTTGDADPTILELSDSKLDTISAKKLAIGDAKGGSITVTADISRPAATEMQLTSSMAINFALGVIDTNGGSLVLDASNASVVTVAHPGPDAVVDANKTVSFTAGTKLAMNIGGTTVDTQYDQFNVAGKVDLTGVDLVLSGTYVPANGDKFIIVNNDGTEDIIGAFTSRPEGTLFPISPGDPLAGDYSISYHGGDGNDVVISAISARPSLAMPPAHLTIDEDATLQTVNLTGIGPGVGHAQVVSIVAVSSNPALLPNPQVTYTSGSTTGSLQFQPIADKSGSATITVTVQDDGGATYAFSRVFSVTINPVNDAPSFAHANADFSATDENPVTHGPALVHQVAGWATNITAGPGDESNQKLSFEVTVDTPGLFTANGQPAVSVDGTLTYTPRPNVHGIANITVVLHDDGGGANSSGKVTFQIEITKPRKLHNSAEGGARNGLDVTGSTGAQPDGFIFSVDALAVINYINAKGSGHIPENAGYGPPFCDVTGNDEVAADDVLKVINYINSGNAQEGEAWGGFSAVESESSVASQGLILERVALSELDGKSPPDLLSLLAADLATAQVKRRRASS